MAEAAVALFTLTAMEIVLGIDNIIFIAIVAGKLPAEQQSRARKLGLAIALGTRLLLLGLLFFLNSLESTYVVNFASMGMPESWNTVIKPALSIKDLVLLVGGGFLIAKATREIHHKVEGHEEETHNVKAASMNAILVQIALIDIVFSLDSVITAVGMVKEIWVMVAAMVIAVGVMVYFADTISNFVAKHPTIKVLALAFLILIGFMLVVDGIHPHKKLADGSETGGIPKGYIYFAMAFSVVVEIINMRVRSKATPPEGTSIKADAPKV